LWVFDLERPQIDARLLRRLSRPRYLTREARGELILDRAMQGRFASYWSMPLVVGGRVAGLVQFGFPKRYRWLPREMRLLDAVAERCLMAAEKARLLEDLAARGAQVRALASHILQIEERERRRISQELHDETGQSMLTLRLQLELLEKTAPKELREKLRDARQVVEDTIVEVRRLISALSPAALEQLGLPAAIRHLAGRLRKVCPVRVRLRLETGRRLPRAVETVAYRLVQESFQNIAKHAGATSVNLWLRSTDKQLELSIRDNGAGFDVGAASGKANSFGLAGMRERVALFGGALRIDSRPGHGTQLSIVLPLAASSRRKVAHVKDSNLAHR
jgi:signal transduction histidine kinase